MDRQIEEAAQEIARALAPSQQPAAARWRWGTVTAANSDGTVDVRVGGSVMPSVRTLASALGAKVGDRVRVDYLGTDAVVVGIRAADNRPLLVRDLGTNPVSSTAEDTDPTWAALGSGLAWYDAAGLLNGQPSQYGFVLSATTGNDVGQLFKTQRDGGLYLRGGNASGGFGPWRVIPYVSVFYASNNRATITLARDVRHLLISAHNSTANLNGISMVTGSTVFKLAGSGGITYSRSGLTITATSSGNPAYYLLPLE